MEGFCQPSMNVFRLHFNDLASEMEGLEGLRGRMCSKRGSGEMVFFHAYRPFKPSRPSMLFPAN